MGFDNDEKNRIQPCPQHPTYFQYKSKPVLLLGGSDEDNLFQTVDPHLRVQLDRLVAAGGNYVRCTMSSRDARDVWPFAHESDTGLYDLTRFNEEYWRRFENFLHETHRRQIIVQVELWATFDFYGRHWLANPFNPKNNVNYDAGETKLPIVQDTHPCKVQSAFFRTTPQQDNDAKVLVYQQGFVDKLLSYSLRYGHVLYCMDNETAVDPAWGRYWSAYVKKAASEAGLSVETTEMWDPWDLSDPMHAQTAEHPQIYSFVEISQNNHQKRQAHWDNMQAMRRRLEQAGKLRPMTNVKIYGADTWRFGSDVDGQERFWRNIFGGCASARFHRPYSGLGLSQTAQTHIRSLRMLTDAMDWFAGEPHNELLTDRADNAAYCFAAPGSAYAVFFTDGGSVTLDATAARGDGWTVRWLDIMASAWRDPRPLDVSHPIELAAPGEGFWAALVAPNT